MKVLVTDINLTRDDLPNIAVTVTFYDDDRESWVRACDVEVFLEKENIKNASLDEIKNRAIDEAYAFLSQILSADPST